MLRYQLNQEPTEIIQSTSADLIVVQGHDVAGFSQLGNAKNLENNQLQSIQRSRRSNTIAQSLRASQQNRVDFVPIYICRAIPSPTGTQLALERLQAQLSPLVAPIRKP